MGTISIIVLAIGIYKLVGMYKNRECEEENLVLKIFGYYFLGSFRFNFNWFPIPLGYIIFITSFKPVINKKIKRASANLGVIMFCLGVIIPIAQTSIYERPIYIQSEHKEISSINFIDDLNIIRNEFDMQKSVSIEYFNLIYSANGEINNIEFHLKQNYGPTNILYEVKYNREKNDDKYIVKRRILDEPINYGYFIDESNVDADYFLEKINIIKDYNLENGYNQYAIALVEKNTGYGILDRRSIYIDSNNEKKELENSDLPVSGQWVKHCGATEILEDTQHRVNLYKNEGIDYIFGY